MGSVEVVAGTLNADPGHHESSMAGWQDGCTRGGAKVAERAEVSGYIAVFNHKTIGLCCLGNNHFTVGGRNFQFGRCSSDIRYACELPFRERVVERRT